MRVRITLRRTGGVGKSRCSAPCSYIVSRASGVGEFPVSTCTTNRSAILSKPALQVEDKRRNLRVVAAHILQGSRLIWCNDLGRTALLVKDIIETDTDGDGVSDVGDEIWALDTEGQSCVVDIVDEVVHFWSGEIHVAMDGGLGGRPIVFGEGRRVTAKDYAKVFVEAREKPWDC